MQSEVKVLHAVQARMQHLILRRVGAQCNSAVSMMLMSMLSCCVPLRRASYGIGGPSVRRLK